MMRKVTVFLSVFIIFISSAFSSPELSRAIALRRSENYQSASNVLYQILSNSRYRKEQNEISYELARNYEAMGLKQSAVFLLIKAVKASKNRNLSRYLERLSRLAFEIGDDTGLNYALSKVKISRFPKIQKPLLYFRFGQAFLKVGLTKKAIKAFKKVPKGHPFYFKSMYFLGLAYSEIGKLKRSYQAFTRASNIRAKKGVVDTQRVAALMGRARVLYHMKDWRRSLRAYRLIPRDSQYFHDMLFESSWAMLRAGKFRSALSNFQSLHSEYYDDYFYPEATLLRGIIYLYICKVNEVDKVLQVYEKTYGKMNQKLIKYLKTHRSYQTDVKEFLDLQDALQLGEKVNKKEFQIPYVILRHLKRSSKVSRHFDYYKNLQREQELIDSDESWSQTKAASYAKSIVVKRGQGGVKRLGQALRQELKRLNKDLDEFDDQRELLKFELITEEKEQARKQLESRDDFTSKVNGKGSRFTYTKNGYEYWPFQGEYWLDEIGNYHYLGVSRCE